MLQGWNALDRTIQVALLGVGGTILAAFFAGVVALIVVWAQNRIAHRAVQAQERTAYLSLIERRARWLDDALAAWDAWASEQETRIEKIVRNDEMPNAEGLKAIGHIRRQALWLFGPEIDGHLEELETAVREYAQKRLAMRQVGMLTPEERREAGIERPHTDFIEALGKVMDLQSALSHRIRPYLFVGDIKAKALMPLQVKERG